MLETANHAPRPRDLPRRQLTSHELTHCRDVQFPTAGQQCHDGFSARRLRRRHPKHKARLDPRIPEERVLDRFGHDLATRHVNDIRRASQKMNRAIAHLGKIAGQKPAMAQAGVGFRPVRLSHRRAADA